MNGSFHGQGTYDANGKGWSYKGFWQRGTLIEGSYAAPCGQTFKDTFQGERKEKYGTLQFSDGRIFVGHFDTNGKLQNGKLTWPDRPGEFYDGTFKPGTMAYLTGHGVEKQS